MHYPRGVYSGTRCTENHGEKVPIHKEQDERLGDRVTEGHVDEDLVLVLVMDDVLEGKDCQCAKFSSCLKL
jgi:hypothetical protein